MTFLIQLDRHVEKQLKALSRQGGNAGMAAGHAKAIISQLVEEGLRSTKEQGRLTRYGEARIKNCIKFDLVHGYRLVGVLGRRDITFLFVGSHAECDHWLSNNAGRDNAPCRRKAVVLESKAGNGADEQSLLSEDNSKNDPPEADYDAVLMDALTDEDLRRIFAGLARQNRKCKSAE